MDVAVLVFLAILFPTLASVTNMAYRNNPNLRDSVTFVCAILAFACILGILNIVGSGISEEIVLTEVFEGLDIAFRVEPLGLLFAMVASGLWGITHVYAIGYMRGNNEKNHPRFFACFSIAIAAAVGIAFSANMLTLFLFYELLTVSTYPLVAHKGNAKAVYGARVYLAVLIGTSVALLLTAVIWTYTLTGTLDFVQGGILAGKVEGRIVPILLGLYAFGIGKAALMPFHKWLPSAMVAPTPVSALLHAVAVVKAGVFTMLKVGVYIFGIELLADTGASEWLMWVAAYSIITASIVAIMHDNLKRRLAYSTVSQLGYITLGMALATKMGILGGGLHIAMHALGKITLFMCAGAIYVATRKTEISQMTGLGQTMPVTFAAFGIGALSIIGLPPLGGSWSKWALIVGAADAGQLIAIFALMLSSILNVAYLLPVVAKGAFLKSDDNPCKGVREAPLFCCLPPAITAVGCLALFFWGGMLLDFLQPVVGDGHG
ncbi:MAG: monovalent cation/H+ antiporter subunit D family protein [Rhodobacteraceae bacterium]|nr:monovalent cation/H+ antiporter subunit D family protein [Paracoccaceae bacterium]